MSLLLERDHAAIRQRLQTMKDPVQLIHFTQSLNCESCRDARKLLEELAALSAKLSLEVYNAQVDRDESAKYGIECVPATVVAGAKDYGIRINGLPLGFEFAVLLQDILQASQGDSGLRDACKSALAGLSAPVHLQVFSTPTCPYCPGMALLAHQMAMQNDQVTAELIDATEYPDLVQKYDIRGVPRTIINGAEALEGLVGESVLLDAVLRAGAAVATSQGGRA